MELLAQLCQECHISYMTPKYRFIEINRCMVDDCPNRASDNTFWSYMDYSSCRYPGGQWVLCEEHSNLAYECIAKELICHMFAPPNPFNGKTIQITYDDQIIDAIIRGFRISRTKFQGDPVIILKEGNNIYNFPLNDNIMGQLNSLEKKNLDEYSTSINQEYFKYVPQILLDRFPQFIIESARPKNNNQNNLVITN